MIFPLAAVFRPRCRTRAPASCLLGDRVSPVTGPEPLIECEWRGCDCDCEALLHTTTTWNRNPNFTAVASKGYFQLACKLCSFRRLFEAFSQNSRSACSILIRQELDSVSGNCCGETIRSRPIHHMRACFALHVEASEGFPSILLPRWERWVVVDPCNSKTIRGARTMDMSL